MYFSTVFLVINPSFMPNFHKFPIFDARNSTRSPCLMPSVFHLLPVKTPGENSRFSVGSASGHAALHPRPPGFHGDPGGGTTATGTSAEGLGERRAVEGEGGFSWIFPKNCGRFHEDFMFFFDVFV